MTDVYLVMKFVSGEEVVAQLVKEDDYELTVLFPMLVKHMPRLMNGVPVDSLVLGPLSHFTADDQFTFAKHQLIFLKDMDMRYVDDYHRAVDDFCALQAEVPTPPASAQEIEELADKIKSMFKGKISEDDEDEPTPSIHVIGSKLIH